MCGCCMPSGTERVSHQHPGIRGRSSVVPPEVPRGLGRLLLLDRPRRRRVPPRCTRMRSPKKRRVWTTPSGICCMLSLPTSHATAIPSIASRRYFLYTHSWRCCRSRAQGWAQSLLLQTTASEPQLSFTTLMLPTPFELQPSRSTLLDPWHCAPVAYQPLLWKWIWTAAIPQHG